MKRVLNALFGRKKKPEESAPESGKREIAVTDPLDPLERGRGWIKSPPNAVQRTADQFLEVVSVGDAAISKTQVMDDANGMAGLSAQGAVPEALQNWFMAQSFIGYQACAIIAQHWLVDKACSMTGEDAIRNGWEIKAIADGQLEKEQYEALRSHDVPFRLKANLAEFDRFKNVFGIRIAIFHVDSDDEKYYEKPFNLDGVTEGSYKGISQVDPYWVTPVMTSAATNDPANIHFYEPEFWSISGKKYHRSHLVIARGPMPADVLKPTYIFGGIPLTQRIYERVYAAERTANEAPLLALNKRTTAIHVDVDKAITNQSKFEERLMFWVKFRDNHAVKVLGKDETMEQFDTSLADFDAVIMNQYQLVAAIAKTPATKLLGTSPKGFNATGDFETISYHEELESVQEHTMSPMVERHYALLCRSLGINAQVQVVFEPTDSMTRKEQADLNKAKAETDQANINIGAISPEEVRQRLRSDKRSGYNILSDDEAEIQPGMSPENIAAFQKAGEEAANAARHDDAQDDDLEGQQAGSGASSDVAAVLEQLRARLAALEGVLTPAGVDIPSGTNPAMARTTLPGTTPSVLPSVVGAGALLPQVNPAKHPKMKVGGIMIAIENPRGTIRQGSSVNGGVWENKMPHHYGYIKHATGADGDEMDCFVGQNLDSDKVFIINQNDPATGKFDEHKCMLGFDSPEEAEAAYHAAYSDDWAGFDSIVSMQLDAFKQWLKSEEACSRAA